MARDLETIAHQEWIGYVQPVGLVVSIPALSSAQAYVNRNIAPQQQKLLACLPRDARDEPIPQIVDVPAFAQTVLGWEPGDLTPVDGNNPRTDSLIVALPEYNDTLKPAYAVKEIEPKDAGNPWLMLIQVITTSADFDKIATEDSRHWQATPHHRFERLLRETEVPIGLLVNGTHLRLVYAPRGETSGYVTFPVAHMTQVAGRPIFAALHMLLCAERVFGFGLANPEKQCLASILADSRKYQNVVSTKLAEQVLAALYELVRGFQAADDQRHGELLREVLADNPDQVYAGLLTVLMRLVFLLYAEDRGLLSNDPVYGNFYSVTGLFERLRADAGRYPDTMDQRYGAWAQLLTLFRLIYEGGSHAGLRIPARQGYLFDPDRFNFLEGRPYRVRRALAEARPEGNPPIPNVSDGVIFRVLNNLLMLDGERLSYRTLDVEQIGSVYETMMGFNLRVAEGRSIAIKPTKTHGVPTTINLEALAAAKPADRAKWLSEQADQKVTGQALEALKKAGSIDELLAALDKKIAWHATPSVVPKAAMVLQPSDERRSSGSHYTPRSLTEPIVRTTLRPVLERLGEKPTPQQLLDLKICDPAMGSGAFLVETCRQLGDELIKAWHVHMQVPKLPPDEDEILHARRVIAQRCLYGVDKNPMAVDLSKLSLWLATLAKNHPFTFLDHSLRHGDSLVGLTRRQIIGFHWEPKKQQQLGEDLPQKRLDRATQARANILNAREDVPYQDQEQRLALADEALNVIRMTGDACVSAFFAGSKKKDREDRREALFASVSDWYASGHDPNKRDPIAKAAAGLRSGVYPIPPFHWEIEFPEVFARINAGFDAFVGNPPFSGGSQLSKVFGGPGYQEWLKTFNENGFGNADLSAYFFRRAFTLVCESGTFGFLATKTISEGDTRTTGLQAILASGGRIYNAVKSQRWPGEAAVLVAVVHVASKKTKGIPSAVLDGERVPVINSRLHASAELPDPMPLASNDFKGFMGVALGSSGFILGADEYAELAEDEHNRRCLLPYLGGEEINRSPTQSHERYAICFGSEPLEYAEQFPRLLEIVRTRVKPERDRALDHGPGKHGKKYWWQYTLRRDPLYNSIRELSRCLVTARVTACLAFSFQPVHQVFSEQVVVFAFDGFDAFALLQSQVHNIWAYLLSSFMGETLRYSVSEAFQTFPFPTGCETNSQLREQGMRCYEYRAELMLRNDEGLTKTYNRLHDPHEQSRDILKLRELHAAMDRAVLETYGWHDLANTATYEFLLDDEDEDDDSPDAHLSGRTRRRPWRYRWPDYFRDEVLTRLLALNQERAQQEALAGTAAEDEAMPTARKRSSRKGKVSDDDRPLLK